MKYHVSWKVRAGGSAADNEAASARLLEVFSKWSPPSDATYHQFLGRLDGDGGFAVVETDNPASVLEGPAKFAPWLEFSVIPVLDIMETVPVLNDGIEFRKSVS
jgi:Domain of unknown function (DUF3303)